MSVIGFLGTGSMGSRMVMNLLKAGHSVRVFNRNKERAIPLSDYGARVVSTPREAAEDADIVISMVRDNKASRIVWLDPLEGAIQALNQHSIAIESSTLSPEWIKELASLVQNKSSFLEAPVLGTLPHVEDANLIYLIGGNESTLNKARPVLDANSKTIHFLGDYGSASVLKLAVNAQYSVQVALLAEILHLLERHGMDISHIVSILNTLPTTSPALQAAGKLMEAQNYNPLFPIDLVSKDLDYALKIADSLSLDVPTIEVASSLYRKAISVGIGHENIVAISKLFELKN